MSRPLLTELGRVLTGKFEWEASYAQEVLAQLLRLGELVEPQDRADDVHDDPADNRILEAAAEGEAEVVVSGDPSAPTGIVARRPLLSRRLPYGVS